MSKLPYVILIAPAAHVSYLAHESDESDGEDARGPARTADPELAMQFVEFTDARAAFRDVVERFPAFQFQLNVLRPDHV